MYSVAVLTISDMCSKGKREDVSGKVVQGLLSDKLYTISKYEIVPDEADIIKKKLISYADDLKLDLVLTDGGTGFSNRDVTPEATREIIDKEIPGIPETMRMVCSKVTKRAMLSRSVAGIRGKTLIINLPGSSKGAKEFLEAILDELPHSMDMIAGKGH